MLSNYFQRALLGLEWKLYARRWRQPVFGVHASPETGRKALFVYLTHPFHLRKNHPAFRQHQNLQQARLIAEALGEFGYAVDVIDFRDRTFHPSHHYDLVLSHRVEYAGLENALGPDTLKIYLSSGTNHRVRNRNYRRRLDYQRQRRECHLPVLIWDEEEMPFLKIADALAGFGSQRVMETWRESFAGPAYAFPNYGVMEGEPPKRDYEEARRHFLFFGSRQQVAKGLDLLLEAFARQPTLHLHVCGRYIDEPEFRACYDRELFHTSNIHPWGWVDIGGARFRKLVRQCAWVVLPSCSEGSPGSVTNAMSAGLVPVLTHEAGIEVEGFGFYFENDRVETVERRVVELAGLPQETVAACSERTRVNARERFSVAAFRARWREILSDIHRQFGRATAPGADQSRGAMPAR